LGAGAVLAVEEALRRVASATFAEERVRLVNRWRGGWLRWAGSGSRPLAVDAAGTGGAALCRRTPLLRRGGAALIDAGAP